MVEIDTCLDKYLYLLLFASSKKVLKISDIDLPVSMRDCIVLLPNLTSIVGMLGFLSLTLAMISCCAGKNVFGCIQPPALQSSLISLGESELQV